MNVVRLWPTGVPAGHRMAVAAVVCLLLLAGRPVRAEAPVSTPDPSEADDLRDASELTAHIDAVLAESWKKANVESAPLADDAEYLRRAYLDLIGKIPSVSRLQAFLDDSRPDKRARAVDELLHRGAHAQHFANIWRTSMLAGAQQNVTSDVLLRQFHTWLRLRFAVNMPYDRLVTELLIAPVDRDTRQANMMAARRFVPTPAAFFRANELKREQIAASTSRFFLGVQVQCAQCHDHPFSHWTRSEFWSLAAFFDTTAPGVAETLRTSTDSPNAIRIPDTEITVEPTFLDGTQPDWASGAGKRELLARWMTRADNPYFAKAAVNRLWDHFLGRGFVHPVDDLDPSNPPSHPELLSELARQFTLHHFDLNYLVRAITQCRAYQSTSRTGGSADAERSHFARVPVRRMTADPLFNSIVPATGFREPRRIARPGAAVPETATAADEFRNRFSDSAVPRTEAETSILQALALMNGKLVSDATNLETSETLLAIAEAPFMDTAERVEMLFMATLTRAPMPDELAELAAYVDDGGAAGDSKKALADVFWALLNSAEFALNH